MGKRFNTLETMRILLFHPTIMYQAIETMNRNNERYIKEITLAVIIRQYSKPLEEVERKRLALVFSTSNLLSANIIADVDKRNDDRVLLFQDAILTLFRLCKASLSQEITDTKLRSRIASLRDTRNRLETSSFVENDPDYLELTEDILEQLSNLLGMLRTNIVAMKLIGEKLENMTAFASKSPGNFTAYRQTMFEEITHLFDRHIKPTLKFLDPDILLNDGGSNLFETIKQIETEYRTNNKHDIGTQVFRYSMSLTSTYKPIQKIERQVDHFLRKTRVGMLQFNAMESQYRKLLELYQTTQRSNLNASFMDGSYFSQTRHFSLGIKKQSRPKAYQFGHSIDYYENIFAEIRLRLSLNKAPLPNLEIHSESSFNQHAEKRLKRVELLYDWLQQQSFRPTTDMVATLHYRLHEWLDDYSFPDLLMAVTRLSYKTDWKYQLITSNHYSYVTINDDSFIYRKRRLEIVKEG